MGNKLTQKEINKIIENHQHWLNKDVDDWESMKADFFNQDLSYANFSSANLSGADLRNANLSRANLSNANLSNADINYANLSYADLRCANLSHANIGGANLSHANIGGAKLSGANLRNANFCFAKLNYANLCFANLCFANLNYAKLCYANISDADLRSANFNNADLSGTKNMMYIIPMACPEEGSFIGFKKAVYADKDYIVKLEILADALRSSATSRKCRCNKAKVLEIQNVDGSKANIDVVHSTCDPSFQYKTGQIVEEPKYDNNRFSECSKGIHFFINRQEAVNY